MSVAVENEGRERRKIREVAREYRRQGYRVIAEPSGSDLPAFLGDYRPALIAIGDGESVVVKVKSIRGFDRSEENREIAARVAKQPGWRFELIITGPRSGRQLDEHQPWDISVVDGYLNQVRRLLDAGNREAAFLLLWANTEALLRRMAHEEGVSGQSSPSQLVRELAIQGLLDRPDYFPLEEAAAFWSTFAHGIGKPEIDSVMLDKLLGLVEALREDTEAV